MPLGIFKLNSISKSSALIPKATGGTISTVTAREDFLSGTSSTRNYILHTFGVGTTILGVSQQVTVEYLIIAGGGSGATGTSTRVGGGGGAGGVTHGSITLNPGNYTITVGQGGGLGLVGGEPGFDSSAFGITSGGGGSRPPNNAGRPGAGGGNSGSGSGGSSTTSLAENGGTGRFNGGGGSSASPITWASSGGGGGQGGAGGNGQSGGPGFGLGGAAGARLNYWFSTVDVVAYAGGGPGANSANNQQGPGFDTAGSGGFGLIPNGVGDTNGRPGVVLIRYT
jgi:hypothetical protein